MREKLKGRRWRPEVAIYGFVLLIIVLLAIATADITKAQEFRHQETIRHADEIINSFEK